MRYSSVLDLHTHTVASGHAYCSLREMAKVASEKGLEVLGVTEHAPGMPGTCHQYYFDNLRVVPRKVWMIRILPEKKKRKSFPWGRDWDIWEWICSFVSFNFWRRIWKMKYRN